MTVVREFLSRMRGWVAAPRPAPASDSRVMVSNVTRQTVLGTCGVEVADSGPKRNKGLLGRKGLEPGGEPLDCSLQNRCTPSPCSFPSTWFIWTASCASSRREAAWLRGGFRHVCWLTRCSNLLQAPSAPPRPKQETILNSRTSLPCRAAMVHRARISGSSVAGTHAQPRRQVHARCFREEAHPHA